MTSRIVYSTSLSNHNIAHMLKVFTTNHMGTHHGHFRLHPVLPRGNLKTEVSLWKCIKCFPSTLCWRNLETQKNVYAVLAWMRDQSMFRHCRHKRISCDFSGGFIAFSESSKSRQVLYCNMLWNYCDTDSASLQTIETWPSSFSDGITAQRQIFRVIFIQGRRKILN